MDTCTACDEPVFEYESGVVLHVRSQSPDCAEEPPEPALLVELPPLPDA